MEIKRSKVWLYPDPQRRITKPYLPDSFVPIDQESRIDKIIRRVLDLNDDDLEHTLKGLRERFAGRHLDLDEVFLTGYAAISSAIPESASVSDERRLLIGAYFSHEYSLEGAALTNPSISLHPDQSGLSDGSLRVILTLRAVGEGHRSSIEFRTGMVDADGLIEIDVPGEAVLGERRPAMFHKQLFVEKLNEMGEDAGMLARTMGRLDPIFSMADLDVVLSDLVEREPETAARHQFVHAAHWVASSNYELTFPNTSDLSQRVLFPTGPADSHGMEDARLVRFVGPDGAITYYATYTAFDGFNILPQLITTSDFETFRIATLNGRAATNKGIAIFPRLIGGQYAALARSDGESNFLMTSSDIRKWDDSYRFDAPTRPWHLLQIGNAGSPIETEAGWLVLSHGVGPMRQYSLGAMLLDIDDPRRIIGDLEEPLLEPDEEERDGYVPNVVYSCGSIVHEGHLVIPYGASDTSTRFAVVDLDSLLSELTRHRAR